LTCIMPAVDTCCCLATPKQGSIAIGVLLLTFSIVLTGVSVGFISGWEHFDTSFLVDTSNRIRSQCLEEDYVGNCTKREWVANKVDNLQEKLNNISNTLKEIGPVWKNEFISLFNFLPWYGLVNVFLLLGSVKEIRFALIIWIIFTIITLIWEFVLLSILFSYDTTIGFVLTLAMLHLLNFCLLSYFIIVVFSYYQELTVRRVKHLVNGRAGEYRQNVEEA